MVDLLPCPFCGARALLLPATGTGFGSWVQCDGACVSTRKYNSREEAAAAWNRRVPTPKEPSNV